MLAAPIQTELLERAMAEPIGLVIETNNPKRLHEMLCVHGFQDLMVCTPSLDNTIFIVKKSVELDP